jgi:hypothetical protein
MTFDRLAYDFQAVGEFVFAKSTVDSMEVQIRTAAYDASRTIAITNAVAMRIVGDRLAYYTGQSPPLMLNGATFAPALGGTTRLPGGGLVYPSPDGARYTIVWPDATTVELASNFVRVRLATARAGHMVGLLGRGDGTATSTLVKQDGTLLTPPLTRDQLYTQYANSWRITQASSLFDYAAGQTTATFSDSSFPDALMNASLLTDSARTAAETTCRNAGITDTIRLNDCILDVAGTGDPSFAASSARADVPGSTVTMAGVVGEITGQFYGINSCTFGATPATPIAFTQLFAVINFDATNDNAFRCSNNTGVDWLTRPFTDVLQQPDGSCATVVAQSNGIRAGVGAYADFQAAFTGLVAMNTGDVTFHVYSDDGWILGFGVGPGGVQPSYVSGPRTGDPGVTAIENLSTVGAFNGVSGPTQRDIVVHFPAAGTYPFELDYSECVEGQLALAWWW